MVYQWETVGNSRSKSLKALKPSVDIQFYVFSTMPLSKWYAHITMMSLWGHRQWYTIVLSIRHKEIFAENGTISVFFFKIWQLNREKLVAIVL